MIIVSVTGPTMRDAVRQMRMSRKWADIFELRLDLIRDLVLVPLLAATDRPRLATVRPRWEGGEFRGSERHRLAILCECAKRGVEYLDVELGCGRDLVEDIKRLSPSARIVVSAHTSSVPTSARRAFRMFDGCGGDIIKWAYPAGDAPDIQFARDFLRMARRGKRKAIAVAMGDAGEATRILYHRFGGWATYASPEGGPESAPGQLSASFLVDVCRANALSSRTKVFGLLGNPVAQSDGMQLHNAIFRSRKEDAVYVRFRTVDLEKFFARVLPLLSGCSVTLPFKERVAARMHRRDPEVIAIGAANTLYRSGGAWHAANSDAGAALDAIEARVSVRGKTMLVLGAGGAARAAAYEGKKRGAIVVIACRTRKHARDAARDLGVLSVSLAGIGDVQYDILVNATPVGMFPRVDASPVPTKILRRGTLVFDTVARPAVTRLLREAKKAGARVVSGREMFVRQAERQQQLFLGRKVDQELVLRSMPLDH